MSHWWHRDRDGKKDETARKGNINASTQQSAAPVDGDSRAQSIGSTEEKPGSAEHDAQPAARLRSDEREEAAEKSEKQD